MWMQFIKCGGEIILKLIIKPSCIFDSAQFIMMALKRLDFVQNETCILLKYAFLFFSTYKRYFISIKEEGEKICLHFQYMK